MGVRRPTSVSIPEPRPPGKRQPPIRSSRRSPGTGRLGHRIYTSAMRRTRRRIVLRTADHSVLNRVGLGRIIVLAPKVDAIAPGLSNAAGPSLTVPNCPHWSMGWRRVNRFENVAPAIRCSHERMMAFDATFWALWKTLHKTDGKKHCGGSRASAYRCGADAHHAHSSDQPVKAFGR